MNLSDVDGNTGDLNESSGSKESDDPDPDPNTNTNSVSEITQVTSSKFDTDPEYIQAQYLQLIDQFKNDWIELQNKIKKPRVLIAGITGSGKSSIINSIFGVCVANVGVGLPITQYFQKFEPANRPIIIYDSKGLECGMHDDFINSTKEFIETDAPHIDIIWYVINAASARVNPFEQILLEEIFKDIPLIVILNKADITTDEDLQSLKNVIMSYELPHLLDVYATIGDKQKRIQSNCPTCGSDTITIKIKTKKMICDICDIESDLYMTHNGLSMVIEKTIEHLPEFVRESFICSQLINLKIKETYCIQIIKQWYENYNNNDNNDYHKIIYNLSSVWNFDSESFIHLVKLLNMNHVLRKIVVGKHLSKNEASAVAILWIHCLRKLATHVLDNFLKCHSCDKISDKINKINENNKESCNDTINVDLNNLYGSSFNDLNGENIDAIIKIITDSGIDFALNNEYNNFMQENTQFHITHK